VNDPSTPEPSATGQPASTPDLPALQRRYPDWHVRRGTGTDPLGYSASREGTLITAPNLARLANAGQPSPVPAAPADDEGGDQPPAILITGPPGWLSGPCYDQDGPDVLAHPGGGSITVGGGAVRSSRGTRARPGARACAGR
jgi:hypothetical protein